MNGLGTSWTVEREKLLAKLWADGRSSSQIAMELGGVSRNAVIGKIHRLGLTRRDKSIKPRKSRVRRAPRVQILKSPATDRVPKPVQSPRVAEMIQEVAELVIPIEQRCDIFHLTDSKCRWPVGDPQSAEFFYCGGKPLAKNSYCKRHAIVSVRRTA